MSDYTFVLIISVVLISLLSDYFVYWQGEKRKKQIAELGDSSVFIQTPPKRIRWIGFFLMGLAIVLIMTAIVLLYAENLAQDISFIILLAIAAIFLALGFYLYLIDRTYFYAEDSEKCVVKTFRYQETIFYRDIVSYRLGANELIIWDCHGHRVAISLDMFVILKLAEALYGQIDEEIKRLDQSHLEIPDAFYAYRDWFADYLKQE